jgi:hypothetical protein
MGEEGTHGVVPSSFLRRVENLSTPLTNTNKMQYYNDPEDFQAKRDRQMKQVEAILDRDPEEQEEQAEYDRWREQAAAILHGDPKEQAEHDRRREQAAATMKSFDDLRTRVIASIKAKDELRSVGETPADLALPPMPERGGLPKLASEEQAYFNRASSGSDPDPAHEVQSTPALPFRYIQAPRVQSTPAHQVQSAPALQVHSDPALPSSPHTPSYDFPLPMGITNERAEYGTGNPMRMPHNGC